MEKTKLVPAEGGVLREIIIGQPQTLNPIFSLLNDADRDISELLFSGFLKYDKDGNLIKDLAQDYKISEDGKSYEFTLKDNLFWSDGANITVDDVVFTIETVQNPKAPQNLFRLSFRDVKVEKISDKAVKFSLPEVYSPFIENFTLKLIPKHIFEEIKPQEFFSKMVEEVVSSGPFKLKAIEKGNDGKIKKIVLDKNQNYYQKKPYISQLELIFVENKTELSKLKDQLANLSDIIPTDKERLRKDFNFYSLYPTRYFALFLNQKNKFLSQKEVREALAIAAPKNEIIAQIFLGEARQIDSPFLPENKVGGEFKKYEFNLEEAKKILDENGWKVGADGIREKVFEEGKEPLKLELNLFTVTQSELVETAKIVQKKWQEIGMKLNIQDMDGEKLRQECLIGRNYDILLLGVSLNFIPDLSPFWLSSQKEYPGRNFSLYESKEADEILKNAAKEINEEKRRELLLSFQTKITDDLPAIFLFSPNYLYAVRKEIRGIDEMYIIDPSKRFIGVENWYIKEKRVPK